MNTIQQDIQQEDLFNWQSSLKSADGNLQMGKELLSLFLADLPTAKDKIQDAFKQNNLIALREEVHKLRGGCCYVGVPQLKALTSLIEQELRNSKTDSIPALVAQLEQAILDTIDAIKKSGVL
jgi:two-component system, NarL family, sensor histidine kinase BarA